MPKLSLFTKAPAPFMRRTRANRMRRRAATRFRGRKARMFRAPKAGGRALIVPLKCGYQYTLTGTGSAIVPLDSTVGLESLPPAWFTRYSALFQHIRINKVRIQVTCPYNIGQHNVGTQALYKIYSKKANSTAEVPPGDITEWLNLQNTKQSTFRGSHNAVNYYFTPGFEETAQPLNTPVTQLKILYKQWMSVPTAPAQCVPHIGILGHIVRMDGSVISNTNIFKVNVTLYTQCKGVLQL